VHGPPTLFCIDISGGPGCASDGLAAGCSAHDPFHTSSPFDDLGIPSLPSSLVPVPHDLTRCFRSLIVDPVDTWDLSISTLRVAGGLPASFLHVPLDEPAISVPSCSLDY
jgi:hypothetical protein